MPRDRTLSMFTVYRYPTDAPNDYVARRWDLIGGMSIPTEEAYASRTYKKIERMMRSRGYTRLLRSPGDDPKIVETWI